MESSPFLLGPVATWKHLPEADVWLWFSAIVPLPSDKATLDRLAAAGYERVSELEGSVRTYPLMGQLAPLAYVRVPGREFLEQWAPAGDIAHVDRVPVALAFQLPEDTRAVMPATPDTIQVATILPPPQFGEAAIVDDGERWQAYTLTALGSEALDVWRRMGEALKELAAPSEWWPYTPLIETCLRPRGYQEARSRLHSRLLETRGEERARIRAALAALGQARQQAEAMMKVRARWEQNLSESQAQWQEVRDMAQQLALFYWEAHRAAAGRSAYASSAGLIEEDQVIEAASESTATLDEDVETEVEAEADDTIDRELEEQLALLTQINDASSANAMLVTNYLEDEAIRRATLGTKDWRWDPLDDGAADEAGGMWRYVHRSLAVYLGDPHHPMKKADAEAKLLQIRESTLLTLRIVMGLWNLRRHEAQLTKNGMVAIPISEVLVWRGIKKHSRVAYPEPGKPRTGDEVRRTDGWETKHIDSVREDFELSSLFYLQGSHAVFKNGKQVATEEVTSPYLRTDYVYRRDLWGQKELVGVFVAPGSWINSYQEYSNYFLTPVDRSIFQLNPQNEQHEVRIALYLVERWREQAKRRTYAEPIVMDTLLRESVIAVDQRNLTNRFAPRIEGALKTLQERGIIGSYECLTPVDRSKARWGKEWLASRWRILPPDGMLAALERAVHPRDTALLPGPSRKTPRSKGTKGGK